LFLVLCVRRLCRLTKEELEIKEIIIVGVFGILHTLDNWITSFDLRKIKLEIQDKDYFDFLSICIEHELSIEENLKNIIQYHLITYRNKRKVKNSTLF
jgi:hypothetical protein